MRTALALVAALLAGCATHKTRKPEAPPLPPGGLPSLGSVRALPFPELAPAAPQRRIIVSWNNAPIEFPEHYSTGLECSTNLLRWAELVRLPYAPEIRITLTNRPPAEFYRAFNRLN